MASIKEQFEQELKNKLAMKSSGHVTEETVLMKAFKYFDLDNSGYVSKKEFIFAINKIGITGVTEKNLSELFHIYDTDQSGEIDYKEFVSIIFNRNAPAAQTQQKTISKSYSNANFYERPPTGSQRQQPATPRQYGGRQSKQAFLDEDRIQEILDKIRNVFITRGVRGISSIGRSFRIMDSDNSRQIDKNEFKRWAKSFRFGLSEEETELAFMAFDRDNSGEIDYDEFLRTIRGKMNQFRRGLVEQAFNILDMDKSGYIEFDEIKELYNAKNHPDVKQGKRTEDDVLMEFLESFENTYNFLHGTQNDGKVSLEEFIEYYENVSMSIDDDAYFDLMMKNCWNLAGGTTYNNKKKGWSDKDANANAPTLSDNYNKKFGQRDPYNDKGMYKNSLNYSKNNIFGGNDSNNRNTLRPNSSRSNFNSGSNNQPSNEKPIQKLRNALNKRGGKGIIGLARQFKIFDDNNSKTLDKAEFQKAVSDMGIGLTVEEINQLFEQIDLDGSGEIDYEEFLRKVRGKMNENRQKIVMEAFNKLDVDGNGVLEISDVKHLYNAKNNKDVLAGKKTEDEVYGEFIETFETYHNVKKGQRDRKVTKEEFLEYYNNISMSIDSDEYFIEMIKNAWKLGQKQTTTNQGAWSGDIQSQPAKHPKKGSRYNTNKPTLSGMQGAYSYRNAPFGTDDEPVLYSTSNNQNYRKNQRIENSTPQFYTEGNIRAKPRGMYEEPAGYSNFQRNQPNQYNEPPKSTRTGQQLLDAFKKKMAARGTRGIMSMRRAFMIADDDNSKTVDNQEFKKFCQDFRMGLNDEEIEELFRTFDRDGNGVIDIDEFYHACCLPMNQRRQEIVKRAFNKLDKDGSGLLEINDLRGVYDASKHPDVVSGKKTEDEILGEYLDNFEYHFSLLNNKGTKDRKITLEEFMEYYNNISMSIDNDAHFEAIINAAYHLEGIRKYEKGWQGKW